MSYLFYVALNSLDHLRLSSALVGLQGRQRSLCGSQVYDIVVTL